MDHALESNFMRSFWSAGMGTPRRTIVRMDSLHTWLNMFFHISARSVVRVTHKIVYPCSSNELVAVAIAEHVLPEPVEWMSITPLRFSSGVMYIRTKSWVGVNWRGRAPPLLRGLAPPTTCPLEPPLIHLFSMTTSGHE